MDRTYEASVAKLGALVAAGAVALTVGACTASPESSSSGTGAVPSAADAAPSGGGSVEIDVTDATVMKDPTAWTLPTDPYLGGRSSGLWSHADALVTKACMDEAGYPQYIVYFDSSAPLPETLAGDRISNRFTEELAAKFGYRQAPDPRILYTDLVADGSGLYDDQPEDFHVQWDQCVQKSAELLSAGLPDTNPVDADDLDLSPEQLAAQQGDTVVSQLNRVHADTSTGEVAAAASRWRECMAPLGIADLPQEPWATGTSNLPESLRTAWSWSPVGTPSADEIRVATFDADCRRSSGWFDALYEAEWSVREQFVADHQQELQGVLDVLRQQERHYAEIIAEYSAGQ